ncbi:abortive infection family protein [Ralstonia sp.]|uniref:abortive infection family protein n=1 Tax=Ralstonia sp. TaxID=54061 RepID=UPI002BF5CE6C|nr:abortive infection family protein [Ralstonia sp.]HWV02966.1 abortive infection family protein [Ralstonia sp.]
MPEDGSFISVVEKLQSILVAEATGRAGDNDEYVSLRRTVLNRREYATLVPQFVKASRDLSQFWHFIKQKSDTYAGRREFLWSEFRPWLDRLEHGDAGPADVAIASAIDRFDAEHLQTAWRKALDRRLADPEGAITIARTLLETTCKHILDDLSIDYGDSPELPHLYRLTSKALNLAPSQHTEDVFKQILGGCHSVVEGLGALRNRLSDAHGTGKRAIKPAPRHAELAVNLSGALALYLLQTFETQGVRQA